MDVPLTPSAAMMQRQQSLAARIRAGDAAAEQELVQTYSHRVFVIAFARIHERESARDLSQEVMLTVLQALRAGQLREDDKLSAFIQGVTRNLVNGYFRERVRRAEEAISDDVGQLNPAGDVDTLHRQLLHREIRSLPATDQHILLLSLVDGHGLAEIARRLGLSHEAVRARKSRALRKIVNKFKGMSQK